MKRNKMLRAVIIDDEKAACKVLQMELEKNCPEVDIVAVANGAKEGLFAIKKLKPDLIFLDIDMPWMSGLELIELLPEGDFSVIFITAYDAYAIQAIKTSALDFLTKPVDGKELSLAINKLLDQRNRKSKTSQYQFLIEQVEAFKSNQVRQIVLPSLSGVSYVDIKDILYCQSDDNYCFVFLKGNKRLYVSKSLKEMNDLLSGQNFYRCHRSYIVNLKRVVSYSKNDGGSLMLKEDIQIPVSRSKKVEFIDLMNNLYIA